ncbi:hypothetical protein GCM10025870_29310 [Agromyces marinus]|uniref:Uncharacterized protein n=2 Tax=Agromyces marinus TaxID=1389020 RepID=A0ABM8H4Y0_9MICO|nr:hypothetical protein GCM10025870_29310 [Agromyces marinus]
MPVGRAQRVLREFEHGLLVLRVRTQVVDVAQESRLEHRAQVALDLVDGEHRRGLARDDRGDEFVEERVA